jgi:hypothetical protein
LVQNYPSLLDEPIRAMRLLVVRKMSGQGSDTVWNPVALADGAAKSYDGYVMLVGEIRGLSFAQQCVNDLVRKLEHDDE